MQIEASTENINYLECFTAVDDLVKIFFNLFKLKFMEKLKLKRLASNNQNMDFYGRGKIIFTKIK